MLRLSFSRCVVGLLLPFLLAAAVDIPSTSVPRHLAPLFNATAVINQQFERISLSQYLQLGRWVVLLFYPYGRTHPPPPRTPHPHPSILPLASPALPSPLCCAWSDFTFVCPTEIIAFSEHHADFEALNAQVLAISTDSHHTHLAWIRTPREDGGLGSVSIPLVADTSKQISRRYGVLVDDADDDMFGAALRGLFIIDPLGRIRSLTMHDDQVGRNHQEALRVIKAFQWAEEHDEVCPASWTQPGDSTLKATPQGIKDFFRQQSSGGGAGDHNGAAAAAARSSSSAHGDL